MSSVCDLCGDDHQAGSCIQASDLHSKCLKADETSLAYQSLPSWVEVQERSVGLQVVVRVLVPRLTKLGPLIAPHTPQPPPHTSFPIKICHKGGGQTFLDVSRKWLCNWLSLIPVGSPTNHNLSVCQIDDLIYYVCTEEITAGSELLVWYAPFYQTKIQKELQEMGIPHTIMGGALVNKVIHSAQVTPRKPMVVSPSLARIAVGRGEVTFTHHNTAHQSNPHRPLTHIQDNCESNLVTLGQTTLPQLPTVIVHGLTARKHRSTERKVIAVTTSESPVNSVPSIQLGAVKDGMIGPEYQGPSVIVQDLAATRCHSQERKVIAVTTSESPVNSVPSIHLSPVKDEITGPECVVRLTITAALDSDQENDLMGEDILGDLPPLSPSSEGSRKSPIATVPSKHKKKYLKRQHNGQKSGVRVAGADMVKQLPPRALGARDPRPWNCIYCGQPYTCLLTFTTHLKAHLLWLVGQCHVCRECGLSVSSEELLQRHLQTSHSSTDNTLSQSLTSTMRRNMKSKLGMENEEEIDDPGEVGSYSSLKRISALPTNPIEGPHSCQICYKSFCKPQYFLRHLKKHSGDFTCQSCLKVFARKESLMKHICPITKEETSLSCTKCGRSFLNPNLLQQHQKKHEEHKKCDKCGYVVSSSEALQLHLTICPSVQVSKCYQCEVCGKQLATIKQLDKHRTRHRQQHHCHLCNKPYTNQSSLAKHLPLCRQSHQISSLGHVSCEECGKEFTDATAFRVHHHTHTYPYKCSVCNHRFQTRVGFEVHVCEVQQQCDQCGTTFRSVQALNRHAAVHGPPPHSCKTCRRTFYRKESLVRHKCNVETKVKETPKPKGKAPCICSVCGVQLANHRSLKKHLRGHGETDGKLLRCETCGKGFHRHDLLSQHQAVHKAPSLPCHTCHKMFKTHKSLEVHTLIHLNVKRFTCKYCNKKFHQKINLIRHERSHLPRGTVKCQYCSSHYSSSQELKAHLLSHTYPHEQEHVETDPLDLIKKEAHQMEIETGEVLLPFTSSAVVESPLKYMSDSKDLVSIESCRSDLLATSSDIHESTDGLKLIVKEGTEGLKSEMDKDCMSLVPEFSTKVMHNVVMNPQLTLQAAAADVTSHSVFIPQGISNFSLSSESPLPSEYLASPITSPTNTPSPHHISNSSVFKVTNHSLTTDGCRLPPNYLISTAVPVLEDTIECHLGTSEEIVVTEQEVPLPSPGRSSEVRHLTLNPGPACLYQAAAGTVGTQMVQDCVSVVIVTETTMDGC